ncbi:hypothetical protein V2S66_18470 [Streptomyces sp. V4-01]|uniref:DUF222 domain-containing protein n=1 Tax=Actinacidiphila polyblastidii TaxID=3110430 RepID=A0ABU7PF85_9ACTN|nr:hypothetical protein [Streptomyces sp. V4-01]
MRAAPVFDPEHWPDGPTEADRLRLLGILIATAEVDAVSAAAEGRGSLNEVVVGWREQAGPDPASVLEVVLSRLQITSSQIAVMKQTEVGRVTAWTAVHVAIRVLSALQDVQAGDHAKTMATLEDPRRAS